jgi:hypothetical protein
MPTICSGDLEVLQILDLVFCMISGCSINPGSTSFYKPVASLRSCLFSWQMQLEKLGGSHNTTT